MHKEDFIVIPKRLFVSYHTVKRQILHNTLYEQKAALLTHLKTNESENTLREQNNVTVCSVEENAEKPNKKVGTSQRLQKD